MLVAGRVVEALESGRENFRLGLSRSLQSRDLYREALSRLRKLPAAEIAVRLGDVPWPGARPTGELDERGLIVPFGRSWAHAQEARAWALDRLRGVTTVGVDGSQIAASREFAVPVALAQAAWFENPHDRDRPYIKDVRDELLLPEEPVDDAAALLFGESTLNQHRFVLEMDVVRERIEHLPPLPPPVVLFDGSLVLSFAGGALRAMSPLAREAYLQAVLAVLDASARRRIPLAGYVDLSFASDLTTMVRTACDLPAGILFDAQLLAESMDAFDRTAVFQCARGDILPQYRSEQGDYSQDLFFVYLKAGRERMPSRIDFPRWVFEAGLVDHMVDVIRAEIVAGSGYPYALETADATAVLSTEDRLAFYRIWQQFATTEGLDIPVPAKQISKLHRR